MNLKIKHSIVGSWQRGDIVPLAAINGGRSEGDRLVELGAVDWTEEAPTVNPPASDTAVAEMPDDELTKENARLKAMLAEAEAKTKADTEAKVAEAVAQAKAAADAEIAKLKADLEAATAPTTSTKKK